MKRFGFTVIVLVATLGCAAYQYSIHKEGFGHTLDDKLSSFDPWRDMKAAIEYIAVGSQFGGVLRGLALFPSIKPYASHSLEMYIPINGVYSELILAAVGTCVSLAILGFLFFCKTEERHTAITLWFLGQALLFANVLLPAIARYNFGLVQSLALRYQSAATLGLAIMVWGILITLRACYTNPNGLVWMWGKILSLSLLFWCVLAVMMWTKFDEWSSKGAQNYLFLEKQQAWRTERGLHRVTSARRWFEAPTLPNHLSPALSPKKALEILERAREQ